MQDSHSQLTNTLTTTRQRLLLLIAAAFTAALLVVLIAWGYTPTNDGEGYIESARQCLDQGQPYPTLATYRSEPFVWNVGFINLVELSLWLCGSLWPLLATLCLMKGATALFMALTANRLLGFKAALAALILFVAYPNNWGQSTMLASEIPSTFLAVAATYIVVRTSQSACAAPTPRRSLRLSSCGAVSPRLLLLLAGLILGLANWMRPTATIFLLSTALYIILTWRSHRTAAVALLVAGYVLFITTVGTACHWRTGHFVYQARSYWFSMVDECYDQASPAPHWNQPVWPKGTPRYIDHREGMDCFDYERIWRQRSLDWLASHKLQYLSKLPARLYYMYRNDYDNLAAFIADKRNPAENYITLPFRNILHEASSLNAVQLLALIATLFYYALLLLAAAGTVATLRSTRRQSSCGAVFPRLPLLLPLAIVVGGTLALIAVMHGEPRFKDPLMPYLFLLAGAVVTISQKPHKTH